MHMVIIKGEEHEVKKITDQGTEKVEDTMSLEEGEMVNVKVNNVWMGPFEIVEKKKKHVVLEG